MTPILLGQLVGIALASGLNLYATVAALGILSRLGLVGDLPPALRGLESAIVIATALVLYLIEAVVDRTPHADSLWDTVHTFVRPTAAGLFAFGILWVEPPAILAGGVALAVLASLAAHGCKAGLRITLHATASRSGSSLISTGEDAVAVALALAAFRFPIAALAVGVLAGLAMLILGPRLWRAFALGLRCVRAWIRTLFRPAGWTGPDRIPRRLRALIPEPPIAGATPRAARGALLGLPGVGAYRNGWIVFTADGPIFLYRSIMGPRRADLPPTRDARAEPGAWADRIRISPREGPAYTLYLLKDGPGADVMVPELAASSAA